MRGGLVVLDVAAGPSPAARNHPISNRICAVPRPRGPDHAFFLEDVDHPRRARYPKPAAAGWTTSWPGASGGSLRWLLDELFVLFGRRAAPAAGGAFLRGEARVEARLPCCIQRSAIA
jgi:hypothetical protein